MNRRWFAAVGFALLSGGCQVPPRDRYAAAERALLRQDLPAALQAFDAVPVSHARYPEARAAAAGVERRMRRSHEHLLEGLLLRSEWRDREALVALRRAKEIWTGLPGVDVLIRATEHRIGLFAAGAVSEDPTAAAPVVPAATVAARPAPTSTPVVAVPLESAPALPGDQTVPEVALGAAPTGSDEVLDRPLSVQPQLPSEPQPQPQVEPQLVATPQTAPPIAGGEGVGAGLMRVEARLGSGDLEGAVTELFGLAARYPGEVRVRLRLVRVLHQRALLRYGQGALGAAILDWERVAELDPQHAVARSLLAAARAEAGVGVQSSPGR